MKTGCIYYWTGLVLVGLASSLLLTAADQRPQPQLSATAALAKQKTELMNRINAVNTLGGNPNIKLDFLDCVSRQTANTPASLEELKRRSGLNYAEIILAQVFIKNANLKFEQVKQLRRTMSWPDMALSRTIQVSTLIDALEVVQTEMTKALARLDDAAAQEQLRLQKLQDRQDQQAQQYNRRGGRRGGGNGGTGGGGGNDQ
jgi:hypothetical protein